MRHSSSAQFKGSQPNKDGSRALLAAIKQAQGQLTAEMAKMDALTREERPDRARYSHLRWQLSHYSLTRRMLSAKILAHLEAFVSPAEAETLKTLRGSDRELARSSTAHIGRWSAEAIDTGWFDYCEASREIRWKMRAYLGMEQQLLFPILERAARLGN